MFKSPKTVFVGDVHGCLVELVALLNKVDFNKSAGDRVVLVGDLVDRGPASARVVQYARNLGALVIQGNHDNKYVRYAKHEEKVAASGGSYKNPMRLTDDKLQIYKSMSQADLDWLSSLPSYLEFPEYNLLAVHAGVVPRVPPTKQSQQTHFMCRFIHKDTHKMLSLGEQYEQPDDSVHWTEVYDGSVNVVYGHHVHDKKDPHVVLYDNNVRTFGLDTGCCFGGNLSALVFDTKHPDGYVVSEPARRVYRQH